MTKGVIQHLQSLRYLVRRQCCHLQQAKEVKTCVLLSCQSTAREIKTLDCRYVCPPAAIYRAFVCEQNSIQFYKLLHLNVWLEDNVAIYSRAQEVKTSVLLSCQSTAREIKPLIVGTSALQLPFTELLFASRIQFEGWSQTIR